MVDHEVPQSPARDTADPLLDLPRLAPTVFPGREFIRALPKAEVDLEGCELGIGDAGRELYGDGKGDAIRFVGALMGSKASSSPSSNPEINRGALGLSDVDAGVELFRETLPRLVVVCMAVHNLA